MAILKYTDVGIHSVSACVPQKVVRNSELDYLIPKADLEKTIHSIGIRERRIAERGVCSSDLCCKAAERLLSEHGIDRDSGFPSTVHRAFLTGPFGLAKNGDGV